MIPLEEARALVCGAVEKLPVETVELLDAVGRVVAADQASDIDVSPFAHSAMDGFALRAAEIADAAEESPAMLRSSPKSAPATCSREPSGKASACAS